MLECDYKRGEQCFAQKCAPKCDYNLHQSCRQYKPKTMKPPVFNYAEFEALKAENERLRHDKNRISSESIMHQETIIMISAENRTLRNELCLKCGRYHEAHRGACDGCRWKGEK